MLVVAIFLLRKSTNHAAVRKWRRRVLRACAGRSVTASHHTRGRCRKVNSGRLRDTSCGPLGGGSCRCRRGCRDPSPSWGSTCSSMSSSPISTSSNSRSSFPSSQSIEQSSTLQVSSVVQPAFFQILPLSPLYSSASPSLCGV